MPENLLKNVLENESNLQDLLQWLHCKKEVTACNFNGARGQFLSYFLNFVHNEIARLNNTRQISHTPKSIKDTSCRSDDYTPIKKSLFNTNENKLDIRFESTPIADKSINLNESICMSPVSPLYNNNHSFSTPKLTKGDKGACLGDFLATRKSSTKKRMLDVETNKKNRRINPTNVNQRKCSINFKDTENSYTFEEKSHQYESSVDQKKSMLEERIFSNSSSFEKKNVNKTRIKTQLFETQEVTLEKRRITYKKELDAAISLYAFIIRNNLLVNVGSEIHYLLSLLLSTEMNDFTYISEDKFEPWKMFQSVHNVLYFISNVLFSIKLIIATFDGWILKNIYENSNFRLFCNCNDKQDIIINKSLIESNVNTNNDNVNFDTDTDNRRMFPSDQSFQAFRKQRDLFYDILRIWEQNHLAINWNFSLALSGKIKTLFNLSNDSANFRHMAKLFKAQLLRSYNKGNLVNDNLEDELSFLSNIPNVNVDKLSRLKTRLYTKERSGGINPLPQFPGYQDFYRQFITTSMNYIFMSHLKDIFIYDIVELDKNCISINDYDDIDSEVDDSMKQSYVNLLKDIKLLAKFLGYIDSLPYNTYRESSDINLGLAITVRNPTELNINFKSILNQSITNGTLIVTVPWIIAYLGMLDNVSLRLSCYNNLHDTLFAIYTYHKWTVKDDDIPMRNKALVTLSIGWLLELPQFPTEIYFNWLSDCTKRSVTPSKMNKICLDRMNIVDNSMLYNCSPFLEEIKKLLISYTTNKGTITVKHITPLSTTTNVNGQEENKMKLKLEEAFLNSQPMSTRKSIDFVSERVASTCIKYVCNKIVPDYKKEALKEFKKKLKENKSDALEPLIVDSASKCFDELLALCRKEVETIQLNKIKQSIDGLLALDEFDSTKELCVIITNKICNERIEQWILAHMNKDIFVKIFDGAINKGHIDKLTCVLPSTGKSIGHNPEAIDPVNCMRSVRDTTLIILNKGDVEWSVIVTLIDNLEKSFKERCDFNDIVLQTINKLLLELLLLYLTHCHANFTNDSTRMMEIFATFWECHLDNKMIFNTILCPRNIMLLAQSSKPKITWLLYTNLIKILLRRKLLNYECFEEQSVSMYKQEWDKDTLEYLSTCFKDVIKSDNNVANFNYLLSFLSDYCYDLNV